MIKAILKKPLNGEAEGTIVEFTKSDFDMLEQLGAVAAAPDAEEVEQPTPVPEPVKAAAVPDNKMDAAPLNKAEPKAADKTAKAD